MSVVRRNNQAYVQVANATGAGVFVRATSNGQFSVLTVFHGCGILTGHAPNPADRLFRLFSGEATSRRFIQDQAIEARRLSFGGQGLRRKGRVVFRPMRVNGVGRFTIVSEG